MKNESNCAAGHNDIWGTESDPRDTRIQIYLSLVLGLSAFLTFCWLRPRWQGLYAARKKQNNWATALPELPDTFFGWVLPLWRITEEQVLASAGLDAYVYLAFFKMAIKFLLVALFFALVIIKPVHDTHSEKPITDDDKNNPERDAPATWTAMATDYEYYTDYLWMYLVFVYLFTALVLYLIVSQTRKIIEVRQKYLGSQTTITDRTIRLSGIPLELRSEDKIQEFIEGLEIGKVESVTLCMNWKELDDRIAQRQVVLRKLEEAWTVHLGSRRVERSLETLPIVQPRPPAPDVENGDSDSNEASTLLNDMDHDMDDVIPYARQRPKAKIWYGRFKLHFKNVDAIDYYEEKLRRLDDDIKTLRKKDFEPTPLAFVTMDSVATAQMAIQAVLDPSPLQLLANSSPAPSDVVWSNTYLPRGKRMMRAWTITVFIGILSVFWSALLVPIAGALNTCAIQDVLPGLADALNSHELLRSLVNTQLPTLAVSLLNVLVPFLYDWLANQQGMISQGDIELSVISKNFFFVFFNFFLVFTILGTGSGLLATLERFGEHLKDASTIANTLAKSLAKLLGFYNNYIILQGFGLFPLRLLEFGALSLYPIHLIGAKTPRDYAELVQPPVFSYGFFLPQTILIFIICLVYSVLRDSWQVLLSGIIYFAIGHFVHKYQLLYAMEHRQHSTGKGWTMMCDRVIVGVVLFQVTLAGQLALRKAFKRAVLIAPLIIATIWFAYVYGRTYRPLMKYIALRSLRRAEHSDLGRGVQEEAVAGNEGAPVGRQTLDEARERGLRGVAGTQSAPSLPILERYHSLYTRPRPEHSIAESMSYSSEPPIDKVPTLNQPDSTSIEGKETFRELQAPDAPKRTDVLRHVLSHPRSASAVQRLITPTLASGYRKKPPSSNRASRRRVAFHKALTSFFHNDATSDGTTRPISRPTSSSASSTRSKAGSSSMYGSLASMDLVSPGVFYFSGPSLKSRTNSFQSTSTSRLATFSENGSDQESFHRIRSADDFSLLEDGIMEPYVDRGLAGSLSDVLLGINTPIEELVHLGLEDVEEDVQSLPEDATTSSHLPIEILQQIYQYLSPKDFNAIRHTCSGWFRASLDKNLLKSMLLRGGWWNDADSSTDEWAFSRRISRECALSSGWTGNGIASISGRGSNIMAAVSEIDFSDLTNGPSSSTCQNRGGLVFTNSVCGQYLLVARETLIFIYSVCGSNIVPRTSIVCPRRVLSMSMDASSGRIAVAALLEGRMGMVCELQFGGRSEINDAVEIHVDTRGDLGRCSEQDVSDTSLESDFEAGLDASSRISGSDFPIADRDRVPFESVDIQSNYQAITLQAANDRRSYNQNHINQTWNLSLKAPPQASHNEIELNCLSAHICSQNIPTDNGISTFYRHLCSDDDPPRSVSICPQRRCVAFGCSAAPSDYLYFLAPRPGFESAKKLRLISSAAHPNDRPALSRKFFLGRPTISSFWGSFGFESNPRRAMSPSCDHYHATPLSDGHHILFVDPQSGHLFLGCDAPLGGPVKLLRKVMLVPPLTRNQAPCLFASAFDMSWGARIVVAIGDTIVLYSVPPDVINLSRMEQKAETWDVYNSAPFADEGRAEDHWLNWWDEPITRNRWGSNPIWPIAIRGTQIGILHGVCELAIHTKPDITIWGFTVDSQCKIWQLRNLADSVTRSHRYVCHGGIVHDTWSHSHIETPANSTPQIRYCHNASPSAPPLGGSTQRPIGFDGNASQTLPPSSRGRKQRSSTSSQEQVKRLPKALSVENDEWVDSVDVKGYDAWFEGNGDVVMVAWD
ncbi:DUF221-domain-containing protein [Massarina eburnea CBS 473.64]|uniref:DUF221-domain-containing protein n=1 Tax=Massarina eburnea CBS 473.64 TaxID=1395130 RepID=A0A6A6SHL2_9PLEO|nr:DUF221-domain-containing protein [Massarina eburnea CBS 473.64]